MLTLESRLKGIGDAANSLPGAPGKWSLQEILGHLIDSASNNLQRFVRAQISDHLIEGTLRLPGYAQDAWVQVQGYRDRPWDDLVDLWVALNRHILHVIKRIEPSRLATSCLIGDGAPVRLELVLVDYVGHVKHHLAQIGTG